MRLLTQIFFSLFFLLLVAGAHANPQSIAWYSQKGNDTIINVDLFLSTTCPYCHQADLFFQALEKKEAWLTVNRYPINQDKSALQIFDAHLQQQHANNYSVPAIFFCDSRWTGFSSAQNTGQALIQALRLCHQQVSQHGRLPDATRNALRQWGAASHAQIDDNYVSSPVKLILTSALTDALTPCSWFFILLFLAFLFLYPREKKAPFTIGSIFIVVLGAMHFMQQAFTVFFYQTMLWLRGPTVLVALLLLFFTVHYLRALKLGHENKYRAIVYPLAGLTSVCAFAYQQTCLLNIASIFQQWLEKQPLSAAKLAIYQAAYLACYVLPFILLLLLYLFVSNHRHIEYYHRTLQILAGLFLFLFGGILLIYPQLLANLWISSFVSLFALLGGWWFHKKISALR